MSTDLQKILINKDVTLREVMKLMGDAGERILFVVDMDKTLLGVLTDGDIRRSIIKKNNMDTPVSMIMNTNPTAATKKNSKKELIQIMTTKNCLAIPIIDEKKKVLRVQTLMDLSRVKTVENTALIMAGGYGLRLRPLTKETPKPLLKIDDVPLLESLVHKLSLNGFKKIIISTHYKAEMIKDYFGNGDKWDLNIQYIHEEQPLGTAGSLKLLSKKDINDLPFIVLNSDLVTNLDFIKLLDFHNEADVIATLCITEYQHTVPYGVVDVEDNYLKDITEKPKEKYFVNAGIYVINPQVLEFLDVFGDKLDMTELISYTINKGEKVTVFPIHEYWLDVGQIADLNRASKDLGS